MFIASYRFKLRPSSRWSEWQYIRDEHAPNTPESARTFTTEHEADSALNIAREPNPFVTGPKQFRVESR